MGVDSWITAWAQCCQKKVLKRGRWEDGSQKTDVMDFADRERGHMARNVYGLFKLEK